FAYEHIYLPTKNTWKDLKNGFDYLLSGDWYKEFVRLTIFNNAENKKILEYELRNKYGDEQVDDMSNFEKDYRMLFGK
ncbi:hypothetical protein, partial [Helicobacter sp. MIT 14-3879]|uniref:hypothetical protein n=1 Tax=Helicobacter sp. MIT 14-3879 TaxID=2040649 RepID=UPI000E39F7EA